MICSDRDHGDDSERTMSMSSMGDCMYIVGGVLCGRKGAGDKHASGCWFE